MTSYFDENFNDKKVTDDMLSFNNKGSGGYTSGLKTMILAALPYIATNSEYVTGNIDFCCPWFWISYDSILL